jgi:predicted DNA-binding transcriptional regulator AlpA
MKDNEALRLHRQINTAEAAEFLGLVVRTLEKLRQKGGGPKYVRISAKCVRYRISDLLAWQTSLERAHTADVPDLPPQHRRRGGAPLEAA